MKGRVSTVQLRLTPKGEKLYDLWMQGVKELEDKEVDFLRDIDSGLDNYYPERLVEGFFRSGYISHEDRPVDTLVSSIPGELGAQLKTYVDIAKEREVSDERIEDLRSFLERHFEDYDPEDKEFVKDLKGARTRGEKIIAIDSTVGYIHAGTIPIPDELESRKVATKVWKVLNSLKVEK